MKIDITQAQLKAIITATDTLSALLECYDQDFNKEGAHCVLLIDRMLKKNGYKRNFK